MRMKIALAVLWSLGVGGCAAAQGTVAAQPLNAMPYTPTLDIGSLDRKVDPCADFYEYLVRRVEGEEPDSSGPGCLGCVWEAGQ